MRAYDRKSVIIAGTITLLCGLTSVNCIAAGVAATAASQATPTTRPTERIKIGDQLSVVIADLTPGRTAAVTKTVDKQGSIDAPYLSGIAVNGLSAAEAEVAIAKAYADAGIVKRACVTVTRIDPTR